MQNTIGPLLQTDFNASMTQKNIITSNVYDQKMLQNNVLKNKVNNPVQFPNPKHVNRLHNGRICQLSHTTNLTSPPKQEN